MILKSLIPAVLALPAAGLLAPEAPATPVPGGGVKVKVRLPRVEIQLGVGHGHRHYAGCGHAHYRDRHFHPRARVYVAPKPVVVVRPRPVVYVPRRPVVYAPTPQLPRHYCGFHSTWHVLPAGCATLQPMQHCHECGIVHPCWTYRCFEPWPQTCYAPLR